MTRNENQTFGEMMKAAVHPLQNRSGADIAEKTGLKWNENRSVFLLNSLGREMEIRYPECSFDLETDPWHQLVILHYMNQAPGIPLSKTLIPFAAQPGGMVRGGGFDRECEEIIRTCLGKCDPEVLKDACKRLGGYMLPSNADLCVEFPFLPRYPLTLKVWFADDEMDASGRMFLDSSAPHYLSVEDSVTVGMLILESLQKLIETEDLQ